MKINKFLYIFSILVNQNIFINNTYLTINSLAHLVNQPNYLVDSTQ